MTAPAEDPRGGEVRPAPTVEDIGYECDWGNCRGEATALRWNESGEGIVAWLPVCARHRTKASVSYDDLPPAAGRGDTDSGGEVRRPAPGDANFPYMLVDTPEEFDRVRRIGAPRPAGDRAQPTEELREAIRDQLAGWPIGSGYYSTTIGTDDAGELAGFLLAGSLAALLDAQAADRAKVERVEAVMSAWDRGQPIGGYLPREIRRALGGTA